MQRQKEIKVLISAGGTGGHLLPAQRLAFQLEKKGCREILFVAKGLNSPFFQSSPFKGKEVSSRPLNKNPVKLLFTLFALLKGMVESFRFIFQFNPDVVVGFGSFHTFPVILAARLLRKKILLFELNCVLGKVNRFFAKGVQAVAVQFPQKNDMRSNLVFVPMLAWSYWQKRMDREKARKILSLEAGRFTFLIFGGSLGAEFINGIFCEVAKKLKLKKFQFQIIHLTGLNGDRDKIKKHYDKLDILSYVTGFEREMRIVFSAADLSISRSGASTIAELIAFELPSILIPYPYAEGHQKVNASFMQQDVKGGITLFQSQINSEILYREILKLLGQDQKRLVEMVKRIQTFKALEAGRKKVDACDLIYKIGGYSEK